MKTKPSWVKQRDAVQQQVEPQAVFVGLPGADGVINGLLPNGEPYTWTKRRDMPGRKYKGRKR